MKYVPLAIVLVALVSVRVARRRRSGTTGARQPAGPSAPRRLAEEALGDIGLVAARELRERTRGRVFRIGTVLILLVVAAAIVIPALRTSTPTAVRIGIVGAGRAPLRTAVEHAAADANLGVHIARQTSLGAAEAGLRAGRIDLVVVGGRRILTDRAISPSDTSPVAKLAPVLSSRLGALATIAAAHLSPAQQRVLSHPVIVPVTGLRPAPHGRPGHEIGTTIIGLVILFVLLSQYSAWILTGVAEEKSSRVVEVLLASVTPMRLLSGKVLGIGTAALAQAGVILAFALVVAKAVGSDVLAGAGPLALSSSLLWLVLGYAFYCWVYAAAGSLAERQSQLQSLSFPLSIPMLVGYIVSITAAASGSASILAKVLAYLPPTAPFAMPVLVGLGEATWWQFVLALVASIVATVGVARFAAGVYRRAILSTGRRVRWRDVVSAPG